MELFRLLGTIAINNSDANRAIDETTGQAADSSERMTGAFKKIGAAVATYFTVDKIVSFGQGCIQAAADAGAASSQFTQVFGELEGTASKNLTAIADTAGISENRMKGSYTKIAAFAKTTGADTETALGIADRAMVAVADSAAFYDRSLEDVTESLQSFLKGNYENDAALGLSCTETTRNAAANALYGKSFKSLSEEQKQLTLLQMVEDANKASGAIGQAARESDTLTNQTGNMQQAMTDLKAAIGENFLGSSIINIKKITEVIEKLTAKMPEIVSWVKEHKAELTAVGVMIGAVAIAIGIHTTSLTAASVATTIMTAATSALSAVIGFLTSPITLVILAIGALVGAVIVAYKKSETFREFVGKLKDALIEGFNRMKEAAIQLKDQLVEAWDKIKEKAEPVIQVIKEKLIEGLENLKTKAIEIKDKLIEVWDNITTRLEPLVTAIKENLVGAFEDLRSKGQSVKEALQELYEKFEPIVTLVGGAFKTQWDEAVKLFENIGEKIKNVIPSFDEIKTIAGDLAEGALQKLNDGISKARDFFDKLATKAGELWDNLDPLVTIFRDNLLETLKNLGEPLSSIMDSFKGIGETIINNVLPAVKDELLKAWEKLKILFEVLKPVLIVVAGIFGGALAIAISTISGVINGVVLALDGIVEAFSGLVEIVSGVFDLIVGIFTGNGDLCVEALQKIWDGVCSVFGGLWDAVSGFLQGFVEGVVGFFTGLWDTLVGHSIVPDTIDGIVNCFSGLWDKVSGFVSSFKDSVVNVFNSVKDTAVSAFTNLKDNVSNLAEGAKEKISSAWGTVKSKTSEAFSSAKTTVSTAFSTIKSKASSAATSVKSKISSAWDSVKSKTTETFNAAKNKVSSAFTSIKSKVSTVASSAATTVSQKFSSIKSSISTSLDSAKTKASTAFSNIKSSISTHLSNAATTVTSKFDSIKSKISTVMDTAKSTVSTAITTIKDKFNFNWELPKLKLPHFSISGKFSIDPPSIPKFDVSWYKKAYGNAMLLNNPTIFGYSSASGKFLGGGDGNGSEVVAGSATLMGMIQAAVAEENGAIAYYLQQVLAVLAEYFPQILDAMEIPIVFDENGVARRLAPAINTELGRLSSRKERGR